jgi:PhoH-like ATPase
MTHTVVLDTSVLISSGKNALHSFNSSDVIIPLVVVRELESKRSDPELGLAVRSVLRTLDDLGTDGDLKKGVPLGEGYGMLRVEVNHVNGVPEELSGQITNDVRIITVAYNLAKELDSVTLVSNDFSLKILASVVGLNTSSISSSTDEIDEYIHSVKTIEVSPSIIDEIYEKGHVKLLDKLPLNTGVMLTAHTGSALAVAKPDYSFELIKGDLQVGSYKGRSREQKIAVHHLMDSNIGVVSLSGTAGSGKSFWMLNAALNLVRDSRTPYEKIVIFRPVNPVGGQHQDLGFLPGTLDEKLAPHIQAVYDTLGTIVGSAEVERIKRSGLIEFSSISHVRGRTLANCIVICDELQNVEATTILTLISRLGVNARVFIGWDTAQRDAQYIGKYDGIYKVVKKLYGHKLFAHVNFRKSERSAISEMVSGLLDEV